MNNVYPLHPPAPAWAWATPKAARLGLWLFMGVVGVLFLLLTIAYLARAQFDDWQALAGAPWLPLGRPWRLWVNTGFLLAASLVLQWAALAAKRANVHQTRVGLGLGGSFAAGFLVGQLWVWQALAADGYGVAANPANSFFYLLTGLHGLHLAGGLVAWAVTMIGAMRTDRRADEPRSGVIRRMGESNSATSGGKRDAFPPYDSLQLHVTLLSRYWHFLLVLWLLLFALLASPPESLAALAALCGLG